MKNVNTLLAVIGIAVIAIGIILLFQNNTSQNNDSGDEIRQEDRGHVDDHEQKDDDHQPQKDSLESLNFEEIARLLEEEKQNYYPLSQKCEKLPPYDHSNYEETARGRDKLLALQNQFNGLGKELENFMKESNNIYYKPYIDLARYYCTTFTLEQGHENEHIFEISNIKQAFLTAIKFNQIQELFDDIKLEPGRIFGKNDPLQRLDSHIKKQLLKTYMINGFSKREQKIIHIEKIFEELDEHHADEDH